MRVCCFPISFAVMKTRRRQYSLPDALQTRQERVKKAVRLEPDMCVPSTSTGQYDQEHEGLYTDTRIVSDSEAGSVTNMTVRKAKKLPASKPSPKKRKTSKKSASSAPPKGRIVKQSVCDLQPRDHSSSESDQDDDILHAHMPHKRRKKHGQKHSHVRSRSRSLSESDHDTYSYVDNKHSHAHFTSESDRGGNSSPSCMTHKSLTKHAQKHKQAHVHSRSF